MCVNLQVFLILPDNVVVYSFDNPDNNDNYIYNGGSLELIPNPVITSYKEIAGTSTSDFKTDPMVLGYANGLFEIVYAPSNMDMLFLSDGSPARHNGVPVTAKSLLKIPDMEKVSADFNTQKLIPFELNPPNKDSVQKYIQMARKGQEYDTKENYWELRSVHAEKSLPKLTIDKEPPAPTVPQLTAPTPSLPVRLTIPFPEVEKTLHKPTAVKTETHPDNTLYEQLQKEMAEIREQIRNRSASNEDNVLREDFSKLKNQMEALSRRLYKIYPVDLPEEIEIEGKMGKVVTVVKIKEKLDKGEIERMILDPLLQAYAGSHRGDNRLLTFYAKDGNIYHVRANYNVKNNSFDEPK